MTFELSDLGWLLSANNIVGAILNIKKKKSGFIVWFFGNTGFLILSVVVPTLRPQAPLWIVFTILAIYGWLEWRKAEKKHDQWV